MRARPPSSTRVLGYVTVLLGLLLALLINHHWLYPDFNLVPGDRGDTRLVIFTLEHWVSAFKGQEPFLVLNMFYPETLALGYADGLFLFALPYSAFRGLGFDYFTSYQLFFIFMTALGFAAWFVLLLRGLKLDVGFAALGAVLLTCLNALQQQAQVGKLTAFSLYPVLIGLLVIYANTRDKTNWKSWASLGAFASLLGLLFFTSYYPAWFFVFSLSLFALVMLVASIVRQGVAATMRMIRDFLSTNRWQLLFCTLILVLSLLPFAVTYAPLVMSNTKRSFSLVLEFTPHLRDIINVSAQNYVWSPFLRWAEFEFGDREVQMGSPLIVLVLFVYFFVRQVMARAWDASRVTERRARLMFWMSTTAVVIFALIIQVRGASLWYPIYSLVPGASALRALGRYLIIIDMIVVAAVVYGLNEFYRSQSLAGVNRRPYVLAGLVLVAALLVAEQVNSSPYRLDKAEQLAFLARYGEPGLNCRAFFIDNPASTDLPAGYFQLDAMMIAMKVGIPTVNGYSGFAPNEAFTMVPTGSEYKYRVLSWLTQRGADDGICDLDEQTAEFRHVSVTAELALQEQLYRASFLDAFSALYSAADRFLADGNELSSLYPQFLEEHGYLDPAFGYQTGAGYKWMQDRYWIGERACNRGPCFGIGVVGTYADIKSIIGEYGERADKIFFPYPESYVPQSLAPSDSTGELLLVFSRDRVQP